MILSSLKTEVIPNYYAYRLKVNGRVLSKSQNRHFISCINKIYRENCKVIYRGEKKETILKAYRIKEDDFPDEFNKSLFIMGTKATLFLTRQSQGIAEINIAAETDNEFILIFRMLRNLINREFPFGATRNAIKNFRINENKVTAFFGNSKNEQKFIKRMNSLSAQQRILFRDYYLALLHHIDKSEYYCSSFLLSTTSSFNVAHKFAWKGENTLSNNPLIFFGWLPKNYEGLLSTPDARILKINIDFNKIKLPIYERTFFPKQHEVTLKGGMLPHYLLGYLHIFRKREVFEINPALFDTGESWNGVELPIDQGSFSQRMQNTMFARFFAVDEYGQYQQHIKFKEKIF